CVSENVPACWRFIETGVTANNLKLLPRNAYGNLDCVRCVRDAGKSTCDFGSTEIACGRSGSSFRRTLAGEAARVLLQARADARVSAFLRVHSRGVAIYGKISRRNSRRSVSCRPDAAVPETTAFC